MNGESPKRYNYKPIQSEPANQLTELHGSPGSKENSRIEGMKEVTGRTGWSATPVGQRGIQTHTDTEEKHLYSDYTTQRSKQHYVNKHTEVARRAVGSLTQPSIRHCACTDTEGAHLCPRLALLGAALGGCASCWCHNNLFAVYLSALLGKCVMHPVVMEKVGTGRATVSFSEVYF